MPSSRNPGLWARPSISYRPESDPYLYEGTGVLRNLANIRDAEELERFETVATLFRQIELAAKPIVGKFDLDHLAAFPGICSRTFTHGPEAPLWTFPKVPPSLAPISSSPAIQNRFSTGSRKNAVRGTNSPEPGICPNGSPITWEKSTSSIISGRETGGPSGSSSASSRPTTVWWSAGTRDDPG